MLCHALTFKRQQQQTRWAIYEFTVYPNCQAQGLDEKPLSPHVTELGRVVGALKANHRDVRETARSAGWVENRRLYLAFPTALISLDHCDVPDGTSFSRFGSTLV